MKINEVSNLLQRNGFTEELELLSWGHSDIKQFTRRNEIINIQFTESTEEVHSFIFGSVLFNPVTMCIDAKKPLNTYKVNTIEDVVLLCRFASKIILAN